MNPVALSKGEQRRKVILDMLHKNGKIFVQDIVEQLQCSEATARRDLDLLEKSAGIIRTIGGALYEPGMVREEPFNEKKDKCWAEKQAIARKVMDLIVEGDVIGLSGGTTTYLISKELKKREGITVVTNAVNIAMELADSEGIQVVVIGGVMRKKSYELSGPLAEHMIENLHIGKTFLGIDGLSIDRGIMTYSELEAHTARMLIKQSKQTFAVFDHTKIEQTSLFIVAPLHELSGIVTDRALDESYASKLQEQGLELFIGDDLN
jgi:DeoR family transcriptional regulator of aga operon/DeoR family fructose operon transcriptional repressor